MQMSATCSLMLRPAFMRPQANFPLMILSVETFARA
jgi:hypothetical protein